MDRSPAHSKQNGVTNSAAPARRWQPRAEWRDDLPLFDERLVRGPDADADTTPAAATSSARRVDYRTGEETV